MSTEYRWGYDTDYQTVGSFAYDTEEETKEAEDEELALIRNEDWAAQYCETWDVHACKQCDSNADHEILTDALYGIVGPDTDEFRREFEATGL